MPPTERKKAATGLCLVIIMLLHTTLKKWCETQADPQYCNDTYRKSGIMGWTGKVPSLTGFL